MEGRLIQYYRLYLANLERVERLVASSLPPELIDATACALYEDTGASLAGMSDFTAAGIVDTMRKQAVFFRAILNVTEPFVTEPPVLISRP